MEASLEELTEEKGYHNVDKLLTNHEMELEEAKDANAKSRKTIQVDQEEELEN